MGTKNLYENGPNPFFFIRDQKFGQADSYGNEKLIRKWTKSVFFYSGPKIWSGRLLWERKTYTKMDQIRFFLTSLSLSRLCGGDTTMKLPNENSHQVFKTRRVRYARADELELYSSSTTSPVKRRHQLMLRFYSCSRIVDG